MVAVEVGAWRTSEAYGLIIPISLKSDRRLYTDLPCRVDSRDAAPPHQTALPYVLSIGIYFFSMFRYFRMDVNSI